MALKIGTIEDLDRIMHLEQVAFDSRAEIREAYELILELGGEVFLKYRRQHPVGMLAVIPVNTLLENRERILSLPENSPFRERVKRGYLDKYSGYQFVNAFVAPKGGSKDLLGKFLKLDKAVGFVYDDEETVQNYERLGCRRDDMVKNIHSPSKIDHVLVYEK